MPAHYSTATPSFSHRTQHTTERHRKANCASTPKEKHFFLNNQTTQTKRLINASGETSHSKATVLFCFCGKKKMDAVGERIARAIELGPLLRAHGSAPHARQQQQQQQQGESMPLFARLSAVLCLEGRVRAAVEWAHLGLVFHGFV